MTKLNLFWSSQTELCPMILHTRLFELVAPTFHSLLMEEILAVGEACMAVSWPTSHARNLGITISSNTTLDKHVTNICRSVYAEPRRISSVRHLLAVSATKNSPLCLCSLKVRLLQLPPLWLTSIHSGQASKRTKFCSKISHEIPQVWLCTTSFAQPSLVTSPFKDWLQDFNPVLQHFHQLFSCLHIAQLLSVYTPSRHLRSSSDTRTFRIPFVKTKSFGQRAFSFTGPTQRNLLPYGLRHSESSPAFKTDLKAPLFRSAY